VLKLAAGSSTQTVLRFANLKRPFGVAVDKAGNLYVSDCYWGDRVWKLAAGSSTPTELPFAGLNAPHDVAVDATGNVYVVDHDNKRVLELPAVQIA
jgi:serine/threonine protein kinase, bacterial